MNTDLIESYAAAGLEVFPLHSMRDGRCTCGRDGCPSPAKHPRILPAHKYGTKERDVCHGGCGREGHGFHDATTDLGQISEWLGRYPGCNWGVRPPKGVLIVDVDPRNGGADTIGQLQTEHGQLPKTLTAVTGGGGVHYWLSYDGPSRGKLGTGVDLKTRSSGYVVAPPSIHASGNAYVWLDQCPAAYAPQWIVDIINPPVRIKPDVPGRPVSLGMVKGLLDKVRNTPYGEINDIVYWAAARADQRGILDSIYEDLVAAAAEAAADRATHGGELQTRRTIDSARRRNLTHRSEQGSQQGGRDPIYDLVAPTGKAGA